MKEAATMGGLTLVACELMNDTPDPFLPTRKSLLTRLKNWDDQEGWREFFDTYWKLIYGAALQAGLTDAEAQDVLQETVIGVARKMRGFKYDPAIGSFKAWLRLNIRSRITEHLRKKASHKGKILYSADTQDTDFFEALADPAISQLEASWDAEWEKNILELALEQVKGKMSAKQFLLFELATLKQVPMAKITRTMGVNIGQVYLAKHRVSRLLKAEITKVRKSMNE